MVDVLRNEAAGASAWVEVQEATLRELGVTKIPEALIKLGALAKIALESTPSLAQVHDSADVATLRTKVEQLQKRPTEDEYRLIITERDGYADIINRTAQIVGATSAEAVPDAARAIKTTASDSANVAGRALRDCASVLFSVAAQADPDGLNSYTADELGRVGFMAGEEMRRTVGIGGNAPIGYDNLSPAAKRVDRAIAVAVAQHVFPKHYARIIDSETSADPNLSSAPEPQKTAEIPESRTAHTLKHGMLLVNKVTHVRVMFSEHAAGQWAVHSVSQDGKSIRDGCATTVKWFTDEWAEVSAFMVEAKPPAPAPREQVTIPGSGPLPEASATPANGTATPAASTPAPAAPPAAGTKIADYSPSDDQLAGFVKSISEALVKVTKAPITMADIRTTLAWWKSEKGAATSANPGVSFYHVALKRLKESDARVPVTA